MNKHTKELTIKATYSLLNFTCTDAQDVLPNASPPITHTGACAIWYAILPVPNIILAIMPNMATDAASSIPATATIMKLKYYVNTNPTKNYVFSQNFMILKCKFKDYEKLEFITMCKRMTCSYQCM